MADFPTDLSNVSDNVDDVLAKHLNNLEAKVGVDSSTVTTSLDYIVNNHASRHESGGGDAVNHDSLDGFVANEHIDWTGASDDLETSRTIASINNTLNTASSRITIYGRFTKTAGASDYNDSFIAGYFKGTLNQSGGEIGDCRGIYDVIQLNDGDVGTSGNNKDAYGLHSLLQLNGGNVYGNAYGAWIENDHNSGTVTGDSYVLYLRGDWDGTVSGTTYGVYMSFATNSDYAIYLDSATTNGSYLYGDLEIQGALSKGSGTFKIDHPLMPKDKNLYYGFVESPRYDLTHRGTVKLKKGKAKVNIDKHYELTEGTFEALTQDAQVMSVQAIDSFVRVKASRIGGAEFTIEAEDKDFEGEVNWLVIAERADPFIKSHKSTDEDGHLINEVEKEEPKGDELKDEIIEVEDESNVGEKEVETGVPNTKGFYQHPRAYGKKQTKKVIKKLKEDK